MEEELRKIFEKIDPEGKISQEHIEEFVSATKNIKENIFEKDIKNYENELKKQIEEEIDWRKKASLSAKIISLGLDN